jgi:hypothetical protein
MRKVIPLVLIFTTFGCLSPKTASKMDRYANLPDLAKKDFIAGDIEKARSEANELATDGDSPGNEWNKGQAVHDSNMVLGRIALKEGKTEDAKRYLLAAGASTGSPVLDSFGPNMGLAKDLLDKGETDTVLQYFDLCRKFWQDGGNKLDKWTADVKAGRTPDFGANLVY